MTPSGKETVKNILGEIPFAAELYWFLMQRNKPLHTRFSLGLLHEVLPNFIADAAKLRKKAKPGKKIFVFATLHYWIEQAAVLGLGLSAMGHKVTLGFLPFAEWKLPINRFDLRRQNLYVKRVLAKVDGLMDIISLMNIRTTFTNLPDELVEAVKEVTIYDVQYSLQVEDVDPESEIYALRYHRNENAAKAALSYLQSAKPNVVIVPNGTIQEFGIIYRVARYLGIRTVTYEFSEQRQRIWLAQNSEIMKQDTEDLWRARKSIKLTENQLERVKSLFAARKNATLWENFSRRWQGTPAKGGEKIRKELGLDSRPVVLLATNVIGDSLTLGRQAFSHSMTDWLNRTVQYFTGRPDAQLIIRVHPGELVIKGTSLMEVLQKELPRLPENIHLIGPGDKINTYDLIGIADLGLVYTTTVGLEMAMCGIPVIVNGKTHYRDRGFTIDPDSWVNYFKILGLILNNPRKTCMTKTQVDNAWKYAYLFFFEFPLPFPWHLMHLKEDFQASPIAHVFGREQWKHYEPTFRYLSGETLKWKKANGGRQSSKTTGK
jgi:hypothetical protein